MWTNVSWAIRFNDIAKTIARSVWKLRILNNLPNCDELLYSWFTTIYLDFAKDVVYNEHEDNYERRAMQNNSNFPCDILKKQLYHKILVHTSSSLEILIEEEVAVHQLESL